MATPNLDKELLRLRIRIGDTYTTGGSLFTTSTSNLNLDGPAVTSAELVEIYNQSIREFIRLMASGIPKQRWGYLLPGYVIAVPSIGCETIHANDFQADYIDLTKVKTSETVHTIIELRAVAATPLVAKSGFNIGVYYPPNLLQEVISGSNDVYKKQTMFTILNTAVNQSYMNAIIISPKSTVTADAKYSIVFLKNHVDLVQSTGTDLSTTAIPVNTLDVILSLAEREYISRRQFDEFGINTQRINETIKIIGG
jgi:hypothetical protein